MFSYARNVAKERKIFVEKYSFIHETFLRNERHWKHYSCYRRDVPKERRALEPLSVPPTKPFQETKEMAVKSYER
jgi:hypothetical protein